MLGLARRGVGAGDLDAVRPVAGADALREARAQVDATRVEEDVARYVVDVVRRTRELPERRARRVPARRGPPARRRPRRRAAGGPRLRDARRRVADGDARAAPPPRPHARRPSSSATAPTTPCAPRSATCRCRGEPDSRARRPLLAVVAPCSRSPSAPPSARCSPRSRSPAPRSPTRSPCAPGRGSSAGCRRSSPAASPTPLTVDATPAGAGLDPRAPADPARPRARAARGRRPARRTPDPAAPRPPHARRRRRAHRRARSGSAAGITAAATSTRCSSTPTCPRRAGSRSSVRQGRFREQGRLTRGPLGLGTDFESIRDYSPDDDLRQINWRATDRTGRPMSNQFRVEQDREVMLLIDAGRLMAAPLDDRTRLDAAVDAAVTVALVADVVGDRCGVVAFDDGIRRRLPPRRAGGDAVVRALFDLEPRPVDADYELAFQTVEGAKRSLIVIFCDLLEEAAARPLVDAVPVLARRHVVLVASVRDPDLDAQLTTAPGTPARRLRPGRRARRPRRPRPRRPRAGARRGERPRGARGRAARRLRARLPRAPRPAPGSEPPRQRDEPPVQDAEPDADHGRGREPEVAGHEPLDQPGEHEPRHRPQHELHRRPRLAPQRLAARERPRIDERPADAQPGRSPRPRCTTARARRAAG